jgi:hypothetical protein
VAMFMVPGFAANEATPHASPPSWRKRIHKIGKFGGSGMQRAAPSRAVGWILASRLVGIRPLLPGPSPWRDLMSQDPGWTHRPGGGDEIESDVYVKERR